MFGIFPPLHVTVAATSHALLAQVGATPKIDAVVGAIDYPQASMRGAQIVDVSARSSTSAPSVTVRFSGKTTWLYQVFGALQDWSGTNLMTVTLKNEEAFPVVFGASVSSSSDPANLTTAFGGFLTLGPRETRRFALVLSEPDLASAGLRDLPAPSGAPSTFVRSGTAVDLKKVGHWRLSYQGTAPARVTVVEMSRVGYRPGFPGFLDEFGQFTSRDWPSKIADISDFAARKLDESIDLNNHPPAPDLYGSTTLPRQATSPTWKLKNLNGRKYFVTPDGKPFWMNALVGVHDWMATMVQGREAMFTALPDRNGANGDLYSYLVPTRGTPGTLFILQRHNLRLKYGQNHAPQFIATLRRRLPSWGFNTIGVQSMDPMYDNSAPFTLQLDTNAFPKRLSTPQMSWGPMPDPYDASFTPWAKAKFAKDLKTKGTMKNLVGVFVDNELSWGTVADGKPDGDLSIAMGALSAPRTQPARTALIAQLQSKYALVSRLNAAWGTRFASFASVDASKFANGSRPNAAMRTDLQRYVGLFAGTYFSKVKAALTQAGYNGLYLGSRFYHYSAPVVAAAAPSVDVLSFNFYNRAAAMPWSYLNGLPKPVMISEFGFGRNEAGGFAGQPLADDSAQRAEWTDEWLRTAAIQPNIVGVQYYEYGDQPASGVADNQAAFAYGLVDIADNPDMAIVNVFRRFAQDLYSIRH